MAVGPDVHLMHDANAIYIYTEAIRVGRELERQDYTWFEEPLSDYDYHGLQRLASRARHSHSGYRISAR